MDEWGPATGHECREGLAQRHLGPGGNDAGQVGIAFAAVRKRTASAGSGQSQKAANGRSPHRQARGGGQAAEQPGLR
jgi:hypothetical protein